MYRNPLDNNCNQSGLAATTNYHRNHYGNSISFSEDF